MHIQQIEIDNFKSFFGKTVIPFEPGFTTISGPNGSGKSNIIDSILFCLGLSTSRTMRAEKLTDLINHSSRKREATVTILFGEDDTPEEERVIVARRIKANSQGQYNSTYYLNGKVSTLTEVHDRLSQHHISPGAYNVLMQGDVTGIINMTPMERRKIIDEIAGVAEFDRKIEQAQKEILTVSNSIERFTVLMSELSSRLEQLSQEREQALKYQSLKEEKQTYESKLLASKWLDVKKAIQATEQNIIEARKRKSQLTKQLETMEQTLQQTRQELTEVANEVKRKGEDQQIALKKQIEGLKGAISRKKDSIRFNEEKKTENHQTKERCISEIERLHIKMEDLDTEMAGFEQQKKELEAICQKEHDALNALEKELTELTDSSGNLAQQRQSLREQLTTTEDTLSKTQRELLDTEAEIERQQREKTFISEQNERHAGRHQEIDSSLSQLEKSLADASLEKEAYETQIQQKTLEAAQQRVALKNVASEFNTLQSDFHRLDAQKRAYEEVNFGRSVDTILNANIPGVHGTLAQLADVDEEFSTALEISMGGRMRGLVVDNDRVAQEGIELLKDRRAGRATFLPLSKMKPARHLPLLPEDDDIIDYAINLIQFDGQYEDVFAYALGDTVIVENMAAARKYIGKYRMVTIDGSLVEKTGAMTGGSMPQQATGKLGSTQKLDQELVNIRQKLEEAELKKNRQEKELTQLEMSLDSLKSEFSNFLGNYQRQELEVQSLKRELGTLQEGDIDNEAIQKIDTLLTELGQKKTQLEKTLASHKQQKDTLEKELEQIDAQLPTEVLERLKTDMDAITVQIRSYEGKIRNVESEHQSKQLEKEFHQKALVSYQEQIQKIESQHGELEKEQAQMLEEITLIEKQIEGLEAQAGELDEELVRLQAERDKVQARLIEQEQQKHNLNRDVALIDEQVFAYQARKKELNPELQAIEQELREADIDPDSINDTDMVPAEEVLKNIQRLEKKMEAMGAVNMRAIEEYEDVTKRHEELYDRIDTLNREKEDLSIKMNGYSELKLNAFSTAFDNVNAHFKTIFAELSDGEGSLVLTNPDEPFNGGLTIQAQPRGKKMLRLEAMSGGEKSLTALAFVFAFQRYMPAPFYAFDEVDMFLDGINAEKLADMVRKQATGNLTQFIVVSLRKPMLEHSDRTVGVTQKKNGITKVTGVSLQHAS